MTDTRIYAGTFQQALTDNIKSGDRLLLKAGTYSDDYMFGLTGVDVLAYPTERAIINGKVTANGNAIIFQDMEFAYLDWVIRESQEISSSPSDIPSKNFDINTPDIKFINCIFHDLPNLGLWTPSLAAEFYGCIIYHNGWRAPDRGHGHGLYIQNDTPAKIIKDCIIFDNFGWGVHAYTENGTINNITIDGCTCFNNGSLHGVNYTNILVGGLQVANNVLVQNCMTFGGGGVNIGYHDGANGSLLNNYFPDGITKVVADIVETGNYYGPATGDQIFLRANDYDPSRANLTIYNQATAPTVEVDVSAIYTNGTQVQARNVQDYFNDIQTLTVTAGKIAINMQVVNRTVATPVQWIAPPTTFPTFGCFVLQGA